MEELRFKPRWVGPASIIFPVVVGLGLFGFGGVMLWSWVDFGPSSNDVFFGQTLPGWWIDRSKGEAVDLGALDPLPDERLRAPLETIETLLPQDPEGVAAETVALNQAIEQSGLPYFVDVVIRGQWPLVLTFRVLARQRWSVGDELQDVVIADRLDQTNVVTGFTSRKGQDLPVVLIDRIEASLISTLIEPSDSPVQALVRQVLAETARDTFPEFDLEQAVHALKKRELAIVDLERRHKIRIRRPERLVLPHAWFANLEDLADRGLFLRSELGPLRRADAEVTRGTTGKSLQFLRDRLAEVASAHQLHVALTPDLSQSTPPDAVLLVYGSEATPFRTGAHLHMRAALGAIRDSEAPACLALARALQGAAGPNRRATAWYYGTASALVAVLDTEDLTPSSMAAQVDEACKEPDLNLRKRAATVLESMGIPPARRVDGP